MDLHEPATLRAATQVFGATLAVVGVATVVASAKVGTVTAGRGQPALDPRIAQVLGARQAVQGVLIVRDPSAAALGLGGAVDLSHALSMVPMIAVSARFRRPAMISAAMAAVSAVVGSVLARRAAPQSRRSR
jgi:hypothetical protein